jgi:hypothetical protein
MGHFLRASKFEEKTTDKGKNTQIPMAAAMLSECSFATFQGAPMDWVRNSLNSIA